MYWEHGAVITRRGRDDEAHWLTVRIQMPIRDGYSATHAIRTEFEQVPEVRNVPIIAMTASAIQGDREKCQQAGMDVSVVEGMIEDGC